MLSPVGETSAYIRFAGVKCESHKHEKAASRPHGRIASSGQRAPGKAKGAQKER